MTNTMERVNKEMVTLKEMLNGFNNDWMHIAPNKASYREYDEVIRVVGLLAEYMYDHSRLYYTAVINKWTGKPVAHRVSIIHKNGVVEHLSNMRWFYREVITDSEAESLKNRLNPVR